MQLFSSLRIRFEVILKLWNSISRVFLRFRNSIYDALRCRLNIFEEINVKNLGSDFFPPIPRDKC